MQVTLDPDPVLLYPVLQVHLIAPVVLSREQIALILQPPLSIKHISITINRWTSGDGNPKWRFKLLLKLVFTCANHIWSRTSICEPFAACALATIGFRIMWANCTRITTTIIYQAAIYKNENTMVSLSKEWKVYLCRWHLRHHQCWYSQSCMCIWQHSSSDHVNSQRWHRIHHCLQDSCLEKKIIKICNFAIVAPDHYRRKSLTLASDSRTWSNIGKTCFARAHNLIRCCNMGTRGIDLTSTVVHLATIWKRTHR